jgi:hypothetical protein
LFWKIFPNWKNCEHVLGRQLGSRISEPLTACQYDFLQGSSPTSDHSYGLESRFKFHKRSQLLIRTHNETLSVTAVRVHNPNRSPVGINR